MSEVLASRWSAVPFYFLADLGDTVALYDRRSGRTHLLDALTAEVLRVVESLQATPAVASAIRDALAIEIGISPVDLPTTAIEDALEQLRAAELLR